MGGVVWLPGYWDAWDAEVDGLVAGALVDLGELVVGSGEADFEAFDLAGPASRLCSVKGQGGHHLGCAAGADLGGSSSLPTSRIQCARFSSP